MFAKHWIFKTGFWGFGVLGSNQLCPRNKPRHLLLRSSKSHWWPGGCQLCQDRNGYKSYWFTVCNVKKHKNQAKYISFHFNEILKKKTPNLHVFVGGICLFFINFHLWSLTSRSSPISATRGLWSHVSWRRHRHESNDPELGELKFVTSPHS